MRNVIVFEWKKVKDGSIEKVEKCTAKFHQFGVSYVEFESGLGNITTAIIEYDDGTAENIHLDMFKFVEGA